MGLAGEKEEHRPFRVETICQPFGILEEQGGALVGGEAAGEANGQDVGFLRVGQFEEAVEVGRRPLVASVVFADAGADQVQELGLQELADAPEGLVGDALDPFPAGGVGLALLPADPEVAVEGFVPFGGHEGRHMDAVGDVVHGFSSGATWGQRWLQMRADTSPWMRDTPLWWREPRIARAVMLKSVLPGSRPSATTWSQGMPRSWHQCEK